MLALLTGEVETPRPPVPPHIAHARLQEFQERYAMWLEGPTQFAPGDLVTIRQSAPIRGHGSLFMVVEVDRRFVRMGEGGLRFTAPPPRSRKTGIREDLRIAFVGDDGESVRNLWLEGWMVEPWSVERAEQHLVMAQASADGRAQ